MVYRCLLVLTPDQRRGISEIGTLSALMTLVSIKGRQMQLVSQVDLSAVISVEKIPKIKPCQELSLSVLVTPHVSRLLTSFLWRALSPGNHHFFFFENLSSRETGHMVQASIPTRGRKARIGSGTFR